MYIRKKSHLRCSFPLIQLLICLVKLFQLNIILCFIHINSISLRLITKDFKEKDIIIIPEVFLWIIFDEMTLIPRFNFLT